jgi:Fe-S cluster biosynthesis and repair protein YggX
MRRPGLANWGSASTNRCLILNEYRQLPFQKEAQELMAKAMEEFFFGEGAALPGDYTPPGH